MANGTDPLYPSLVGANAAGFLSSQPEGQAEGGGSLFQGNPLAAIGLGLASAAGGMRGDFLLPIVAMQQQQQAAAAKQRQQQELQRHRTEQVNTVLSVLDRAYKMQLPLEARKKLGEQAEQALPGLGQLFEYEQKDYTKLREQVGQRFPEMAGILAATPNDLLPSVVEGLIGGLTQVETAKKKEAETQLGKAEVEAARRENIEKAATQPMRVVGELAKGARESIAASREAQELPFAAAEAGQKAASRTRELVIDAEGTIETQEWQPGKGWVKVAAGKKAPGVQVNISPGERKERTEAIATLKGLQDILGNFRGRYVGPIDSRLGSIMSTLNVISQPEANFRSAVGLLRTELRKFYFGTAQSRQELEGALEALPSLELSDKQFPAAVKASVDKLHRYLSTQDEVLRAQSKKSRPSMGERLGFLTDVLGATENEAFSVLMEEGY